jgi:hypothetical protein
MPQPERESNNFETPKPTIRDLQKSAPTGWGKKALAWYLIPSDPENSIKCHELLGTPIIRKAVMGTMGRLFPPGSGLVYRLDHNLPGIEAETNFMLKASVINELVDTVGILALHTYKYLQSGEIDEKEKQSHALLTGLYAAVTIINLGAIALQRYNRARMVKRVNERFQNGETYADDYENYLGIDARAVRNFQEQQAENRFRQAEESKAAYHPQETTIFHRKNK